MSTGTFAISTQAVAAKLLVSHRFECLPERFNFFEQDKIFGSTEISEAQGNLTTP
jgi:hypothetical protein